MSAPITPGPNPLGLGRPHIGIPLHISHGGVQGYMMPNERSEDDAVARVAAKFQAFYDALASDEQEIVMLLLEQAAGVRA